MAEREKQRQRALLQYFRPENRRIVIEALEEIHRTDLIGNGPDCLVAPDREYAKKLAEKKSAQRPKVPARGHHSAANKSSPKKGGKRR